MAVDVAKSNISIRTKEVMAIRAKCPYCLIGFGTFTAERVVGGEASFHIKDPIKCTNPLCQKPFMVRPKIEWMGVKMEDIVR